jgi:DNA methylase
MLDRPRLKTQLARYDAMCVAIASAHEVDEVKDIRNQAVALEAYSRQARNHDNERYAAEIRIGPHRLTTGTHGNQNVKVYDEIKGANRRSVWTIPTRPFADDHFATFPAKLVEPCILAGCPEGGTVLDPFAGSGMTALVAGRFGRKATLIELNPEYAKIIKSTLSAAQARGSRPVVARQPARSRPAPLRAAWVRLASAFDNGRKGIGWSTRGFASV